MSVPAAFAAVIIIWSTTPLAIQWSGQGGGFLLGVSARMLLGAALCGVLMLALRVPLPLHRAALQTYVAAGLGLFGAMTSVYWGAQFIPSGWVSVVFGLTPLVTGLLAWRWLGEQAFTPRRVSGLVLAFAGLLVMFAQGSRLGPGSLWGLLAVLLSVTIHSFSAVWVKRIGAAVPAVAVTGGGLLAAAPAYALSWWVWGGPLPPDLPGRTLGAILYLALFGSVVGFILYFYLLKQVEASTTALITLVTPVLALLLGTALNGEVVPWPVGLGTGLILLGLGTHQGLGLGPVRRVLAKVVRRTLAVARSG